MVAVQQQISLLQGNAFIEAPREGTGNGQVRQRGTPPSQGAGLLLVHDDKFHRYCKLPTLMDVLIVAKQSVAGGERSTK